MREEREDFSILSERIDIFEKKFKLLERFTNFKEIDFKELLSIRGFKDFTFKEPQDTGASHIFNELSKYYIRRFLSDFYVYKILKKGEVLNLCSKWKVEKSFLDQLLEGGVLSRETNGYSVGYDFDLLVESFIARFLKERFNIESILNVKLKELKNGGDIDILGKWKLELLIIELKESPPNNISLTDLKITFERFRNIKPDLFILLIDTTLSIKRNILDNLSITYGISPVKLREGVYKIYENAFVVTAKRDMLSNIGYVIERKFL